MTLRKITSLTMLLSFVFCILSSVVLYIVPQGRVAYWANWQLWGLSKTQWGELHLNLGFLFLVAGLLHLFYNWSVVAAYLKNKGRQFRLFTPSFNMALILTLAVGLGTYWRIPPMSTILELGDSIKAAAARKYGEPPYGHAELSPLASFYKKAELDPVRARELLAAADLLITDEQQTIAAIAAAHGMTPSALYAIIRPASTAGTDNRVAFPDEPAPGFGNRTLAELCAEYDLQPAVIIEGLAHEKISARPEQTIREIAVAAGMEPRAFFTVLHKVATQPYR